MFVAIPAARRASSAHAAPPVGASLRVPDSSWHATPGALTTAASPSATCIGALRLLEQLAVVRRKLVLPLASAASALHARSAWLVCGHRSREDFVRERFARSGRWFQDLVRLEREVVRLPGLAAALCGADGEPVLGHKAALCIARVATSQTAAEWIAIARTLPLEELQRRVRGAAQARAAPEEDPGQEGDPGIAIDDPATVRARVRLQGPPEARLAFDALRELHAAVAGREAGTGAFVEALIFETASAGAELAEDLRASALRSKMPARTAPSAGRKGATGTAQDHRTPGVIGTTPAARRALQTLHDFEVLDARLGALQRKIASHARASSGLALSDTYVRHLERLTAILAGLVELEGRLDIAIAALLLELHERRAWKSLGFAGLEDCAESLGWGASTARQRVAVARRTRRFAPLQRAYESGRLSAERALWVARRLEALPTRTTSATPLIEHATRAAVKHLRDEEKCVRRETLLGHVAIADSMTPSPASRRRNAARDAAPRVKTSADALPRTGAVAEASAVPQTSANSADGSASMAARRVPAPMDEAAVHAALRRVPGATRHGVFALGFGLLDRVVRKGPLLSTTWSLELPLDLATDLVACIEAVRRALAAPSAPGSAAKHSQLTPSGRMARALSEQGERLPDWLGLFAILEDCAWQWDAPKSMPCRPFDAIYRRDGYRCKAPGCTARDQLETHHLHYRSRGGSDRPTNLLTLCFFHHQQGEHGLLAHCQGTAPLDVRWRLGYGSLATWWRNEMRLNAPPSFDGKSVADVLDEIVEEEAPVREHAPPQVEVDERDREITVAT